MATNVEIKARVRDVERLRARAREVSDAPPDVFRQEDVFFPSPSGRLKLRILSPSNGQLIYYERPDAAGPRQSRYFVFETSSPRSLLEVMAGSLGVRGRVRKTRSLYMAGTTRIHLDDVEGLGTFAEIEVVLGPLQSPEDGASIAHELMNRLGIEAGDLVTVSYIDLLEAGPADDTPTNSGHQAADSEAV